MTLLNAGASSAQVAMGSIARPAAALAARGLFPRQPQGRLAGPDRAQWARPGPGRRGCGWRVPVTSWAVQ